MTFATIDIVFGSLVLVLVLRCTLRGFVEEFLSMAAIVLGVLAAILLNKPGADFVRTKIEAEILPEAIAFAALFAIVFVLVKILEYILKDIIERIRLGGVNRFLGILLGLVEGLLVVSVALFVLSIQPLFDPTELLEKSFFARYLLPFVGTVGSAALSTKAGS
jgi:membrane protein required for colicin V production